MWGFDRPFVVVKPKREPSPRLAANNPAHRSIMAQPGGVVHILVSGKPPKHGVQFTHTLALMAAHGKPASIADNLIAAGDAPPVKVLIIDGEMILSDLKARTAAIFKSNGQNQLLENLRLYAKSDQDPVAQFIDLAQPAWKTRIIAEVKNQGFSLVIFDNLSTLSPSLEDENSAVAWNPLNDLL